MQQQPEPARPQPGGQQGPVPGWVPPTANLKPKKPIWQRWWFIAAAAVIVLSIFGNLGRGQQAPAANVPAAPPAAMPQATETPSESSPSDWPTTTGPVDQPTEEPAAEEEFEEEEFEESEPEMTFSQENAVEKAEDYLAYTAFSRKGLIKQLKYEGFSTKDSTFAVDYVTVSWKKQAVRKAKEYLDYSSFSRAGLIRQLKYEGFSTSHARYGAKKAGL